MQVVHFSPTRDPHSGHSRSPAVSSAFTTTSSPSASLLQCGVFASMKAYPFDHVSSEQVQRIVRTLLGELAVPRDREILVRTYLKDEDKAAICEKLGIDSAHYNRVLFRAKQRFRELLVSAAARGRLHVIE